MTTFKTKIILFLTYSLLYLYGSMILIAFIVKFLNLSLQIDALPWWLIFIRLLIFLALIPVFAKKIVPNSKPLFSNLNVRSIIKNTLISISILSILGYIAIYWIKPLIGISQNSKNLSIGFTNLNISTLYIQLFMILIATPIIEEFIFRGMLMNLLNKYSKFWIDVIISSTIFGLAHLHVGDSFTPFWYYSLLGVIFASIFKLTKDIRYSIASHILLNTILSWKIIELLLFSI